ncbi:hypothetical protein EJ08DRAFT_108505 [Tothia fuscella]|uniref:C3H1-type domain-containing protein n=1 Tax=Tothia fuscella TaxID=1048955 RepID=A0A9P4U0Q2_9PEZI|nr:hypothetical protein EJ08DRAFT_108505 [Tothia fuscella]
MGNFQSHTERPGLWSSENAALPPLRKSIAPTRKKTHCDKWIQTGTCAFSQQGCIFKHEMPDPQTLGKWFGSTSIPIWYVKRTSQAYLQLQDGVKRGLADLRERGDGDEWSKADKERVRELAVWVLGKALMEGVEDEELEGRIWDAVLR